MSFLKNENIIKILLAILIACISLPSQANMASPIIEGSLSFSPFISQHVNITHENILIIPDEKFETARFVIEYHIHAEQSGNQIPLLFYAIDFLNDFRVWLNGEEIQLSQVPEAYEVLQGTPFADFDYFFENNGTSSTRQVHIEESSSRGFYLNIDDLKFFETDLTEGNHIIRVEY